MKEEKITRRLAKKTGEKIIEIAEKTGKNDPVGVTIVGINGQVIITDCMDDLKGISPELSRKKAYTALMIGKETRHWEEKKKDPRNFGDDNVTCFGGGVPVMDSKGRLIGGIGVSGRKSFKQTEEDNVPQDHELATAGLEYLVREMRKTNF